MSKPRNSHKRKTPPPAAADGATPSEGGTAMPPAETEAVAVAETPTTIELEAGLEIKDVESAHRRLTAALSEASALTVDVSRIGSIDTAGVQLLLALRRTAGLERRSLTFTGESAALTHALGALGLDRALSAAAPGE